MTRADHVVALGGGVVGDLAGFCAAIYQRGVPVVRVPTTLLAQVDSSIGGKTGVDLPEAKNYVGAYHLPAGVVTDTGTLASLPGEELAAGFVEVLKTALLAGGDPWERVRALETLDPGAMGDIVFDCALHKAEVVAADERDSGRRQSLNLGHTVGHAIEAASGYRRYRHGEAVGLGLLAALRLCGCGRPARGGGRRPCAPRPAHRARPRRRDRRRAGGTATRQEGRCRGAAVRAALGARVAGDGRTRGHGLGARGRRGAEGGLEMRNRVEVLHGANLDMLGARDPEHYGSLTLAELEVTVKRFATELDLETRFFQTNGEGEFIEYLHRLPEIADAALVNAGAWTHYSYAIRDALELARVPAVEVHLSDVMAREEWRRRSVFEGIVVGTVAGQGPDGYRDALAILKAELEA